MLYKPRMAEVAAALGAVADDRDMPFGWALRVSETGEVSCRDVLSMLTEEELRRVAALWQLQGWEHLTQPLLVDALCRKAEAEAGLISAIHMGTAAQQRL
jgi:hypothetical protein